MRAEHPYGNVAGTTIRRDAQYERLKCRDKSRLVLTGMLEYRTEQCPVPTKTARKRNEKTQPVETQCLCLGNNNRRGHNVVSRKQHKGDGYPVKLGMTTRGLDMG